MKFSDWTNVRESSEPTVSGPGIKAMQAAVSGIASGAASKLVPEDLEKYREIQRSGYATSTSIPIMAAMKMLNLLRKYKDTQVPNYDQIGALVRKDMAAAGGSPSQEEAPPAQPEPLPRPTSPKVQASTRPTDIQILRKERNNWGNKILIRMNRKSKSVYFRMKDLGLAPKGIIYAGDENHLVNIDDRILFDRVVSVMKDFGLDVSPLEEFMRTGQIPNGSSESSGVPERPEGPFEGDKSGTIRFMDGPANTMRIKTTVHHLPQEVKDFVRESIQYTFPDYTYTKESRDPANRKKEWENWYYTVAGNYKQYVSFGRLLSRFGYPVDELRKIVALKKSSGRIPVTEWEGRFDSDKDFQDSIEKKLPESMVDLYDEQKFGVAFLYGRDHAILGDETGFGKSIQLITAAALRMQNTNKPTLIITLKATQKQFANEILRVMGEGEKNNISLDPSNPKKWTVIRYSDFSGGAAERNKKVQEYIGSLRRVGFGVAILDELHKVKHGRSQRSKNIENVVGTIPTRWGASATVSSNKPTDVKNQLLMMGHQLGKIDERKFKRDFAGITGRRKKGSGNDEGEIRAAERLNKWLNLSGVYVRREKGDIREMPKLSVDSDSTTIDPTGFQDIYAEKMREYQARRGGKPVLPVNKLMAARLAVAQLKTDETTRKVLKIVSEGEGKPPAASKVVVFTNFKESGKQLVAKISEGLKSINPKYRVITYLSDTAKKERDGVKSVFTDDPNAKVLVMSMKMGGTGIDFPNASQNMVINDFDWTPESAEQSEGRIYRINTDHPVDIRYVVGHGLDRELFERVQRKREISAIIQKYRREYHDAESAPEALKKIVAAQKEIKKINDEMVKIVATELPGAEKALKTESFSSYLSRIEEASSALFPSE